MKHLLLPTLLLLALNGCAQTPSSKTTDTQDKDLIINADTAAQYQCTYCVHEHEPEFPGGMEALYAYLDSAVRYPQVALDYGIEGKIFLTFVVETDGSITEPRVMRGLPGGCSRAAVDAVRRMPRWSPGKQYCTSDSTLVPVRVQFNLPVNFRLDPRQPRTIGGSEEGDKEVIPTYPGGIEALYRYLATHIDRPLGEWVGVLTPTLDFDSVGTITGVRLPDCNPMADALREAFHAMPRWNMPTMKSSLSSPLLIVPINLPKLLELRNKQ
ncbi:MAG: energy transducer TonB [Bacteroidales bacterium]|nr:energy transducer TonB [Bacteroidales bacterium]